MNDKSNPPGDPDPAAFPHVRASETGGSHLAHWPPPQRGQEAKHVPVKHQPGQPDANPKPHGLSLTRSAFKDDDGD